MVEFNALLTKLIPVEGTHAVAWRGKELLTGSDLLSQVVAWTLRLNETPSTQHVAVYFQDSFSAAAALLGAWLAGRTVILPSDAQAETVRRLKVDMQARLLGDFPDAECVPEPTLQRPALKTLEPEHLALIVFTSGSTGEPLAIPKTLGQIVSELVVQTELWGAYYTSAGLVSTVSHQHIYGLLFRLLLPLITRSPFVAERLEYPEEVQACLARHSSVLISSPAFLKRLPDVDAWLRAPVAIFSSGGPLLLEAAQRAEAQTGAPVFEIYGSSETGGVAWRRQTQGAFWNPLPQVELDMDAGLLTVRSSFVFKQEWHRTSDHARLAENGQFELEGRADRLVKIEEKRISLDGIETELLLNSEVAEARVLVLPEERARLGAVVVLSPSGKMFLGQHGKRALNEKLRAALLRKIERVALPRYWRYVDTLPSNAMGKTTMASLLALFGPINTHRYPLVVGRELENHRIVLQLAAEPNLPWFDGHFPSMPILPGVALLQWVEHFGRLEFPLPPDFMRMDAIKFQQVIRPGTVVRLEMEWQEEKNAISFKASSEQGSHASGRISFGERH